MKKKIQNKLGTYLAVTAGVGCASSVANAAVVFYGNASNPNIQADPSGISFGRLAYPDGSSLRWVANYTGAQFGASSSNQIFFRGTSSDLPTRNFDFGASYTRRFTGLDYGAVLGGDNYVNVSFNGYDSIYEAVAQFYLDGTGGGYLMAIATTNPIPNPQNLSAVGGPALSISAGKAMIDAAAAVPEPSSLMLLALGATGLAARRQRRKAT